MKKPKVIVLKTEGTNCDEETLFAFELAGGEVETVHVNQLRDKSKSLKNFQILAIPGGFSYGDDVVSGKILAVELTSYLAEELKNFINRPNTLVLGICNGFQVLIRTGLLPFGKIPTMQATLTNNTSGRFECRWINLKKENGKCVFLKNLDDVVFFQVAHGEGRFFAPAHIIEKMENNGLVALRYSDNQGNPSLAYPINPNGSLNAIAGVTDPTGRILGLMPHPERFVRVEQHPNWRRLNLKRPQGLSLFTNMVEFVKSS